MDERQKTELIRLLDKDVHFSWPMGMHTTFRAGGNAEALCAVKDVVQLKEVLSFARRESLPSLVVGKGSNLLAIRKPYPWLDRRSYPCWTSILKTPGHTVP